MSFCIGTGYSGRKKIRTLWMAKLNEDVGGIEGLYGWMIPRSGRYGGLYRDWPYQRKFWLKSGVNKLFKSERNKLQKIHKKLTIIKRQIDNRGFDFDIARAQK